MRPPRQAIDEKKIPHKLVVNHLLNKMIRLGKPLRTSFGVTKCSALSSVIQAPLTIKTANPDFTGFHLTLIRLSLLADEIQLCPPTIHIRTGQHYTRNNYYERDEFVYHFVTSFYHRLYESSCAFQLVGFLCVRG